jgi:hypothetical protein
MREIYTVWYHKEKNYHIRYWQNQNPYVGSKSFHTIEEAKAFAKTVDAFEIRDYNRCKKIPF